MKLPSLSAFLPLFFLLIAPNFLLAQGDCLAPHPVSIPLKVKKEDKAVRKILYGKKDRFTLWYRIDVQRSRTVSIRISSTNPKDLYELSLYRYNGDRPCRELVHGDLDPLKRSTSEWKGRTKGHRPRGFRELELKTGSTYYLSVLHVRGKGCGHIATFSSNEKKMEIRARAKDCFKVPEPPEKEKPKSKEKKKVRLVTALKDSSNGKRIAGQLMIMDRENGEKRFISFKGDSARTLRIRKGVPYRFKGEALGYHGKSIERSFEQDSSFFLRLPRLEKGEKIVLRRIYFHPNTYAFRKGSERSIDALYRYMKQRPKARIEIQGHTASDRTIEEKNPLYRDKGKAWNFTGTAEELSELRAKAVKKELVSRGVDEKRIKTKGFGASQKLVKDPQTQREEQKNMRVEIRILR